MTAGSSRPECRRVSDACHGGIGTGGSSARPDRRLRIGNALEHDERAFAVPFQRTGWRVDDRTARCGQETMASFEQSPRVTEKEQQGWRSPCHKRLADEEESLDGSSCGAAFTSKHARQPKEEQHRQHVERRERIQGDLQRVIGMACAEEVAGRADIRSAQAQGR